MSDERPKDVVDPAVWLKVTERHDGWVHPDRLIRLLSRAGLALVRAADVPTPEERAVLEAIGKAGTRELRQGTYEFLSPWRELCEAELARRAAKEGNRG